MDGSQKQGMAIEWLNRIYVSTVRGMVFAKSGVWVSPGIEFKKVYQIRPGAFVSHLHSDSQGDYVLYFRDTNEKWAQGLTDIAATALQGKAKKSASWSFTLLPSAYAEEGPNHFCENTPSSASTTQKALGTVRAAGSCLKDVVHGAWQATGGMVVGGWHAIWHPVETYDKIVKELAIVGKLYDNFTETFGEMKQQIANLPPEVTGQIVCELTGNIGAGALVTFLTVGGGGPFMAASIAKTLAKVAEKTTNLTLKASLKSASVKMAKKAESAYKIKAAKASDEGLKTAEAAREAANDGYIKAINDVDGAHKKLYDIRARTKSLLFQDTKKDVEEYLSIWKDWKPIPSEADSYINSFKAQAEFLQRKFQVDPQTRTKLNEIVREVNELNGETSYKFTAEERLVRGKRMREDMEYYSRKAISGEYPLEVPMGGWAKEGVYDSLKAAEYDPAKAKMDAAFDEVKKANNTMRATEEPTGGTTKRVVAGAVTGIATCETIANVRSAAAPQTVPSSASPTTTR